VKLLELVLALVLALVLVAAGPRRCPSTRLHRRAPADWQLEARAELA
jgi:hypothetical protein